MLGSQDVSLPHAATGRPGAFGVHVCACVAWVCAYVCVCMHVLFGNTSCCVHSAGVVSGDIACIRWVVFVVATSYARLCMVCVCVCVCVL